MSEIYGTSERRGKRSGTHRRFDTMSISVEKAVIARITKAGEKFEILVDPELALQVKSGKEVKKEDLLAVEEVYTDSKKGLKPTGELINKTFGTNSIEEIAKKIIKDGDVQLTTEQRKKMLDEKEKAIASIISKQGINPQTNAPNPSERILKAMEQAKVRIELTKSPEEQVESVITAIRSIIPINIQKIKLSIKVSANFAAKSSSIIRNFAKPNKEDWGSDGSYMCTIEIPAGMKNDVFDKLNSLTHGDVQIKEIK